MIEVKFLHFLGFWYSLLSSFFVFPFFKNWSTKAFSKIKQTGASLLNAETFRLFALSVRCVMSGFALWRMRLLNNEGPLHEELLDAKRPAQWLSRRAGGRNSVKGGCLWRLNRRVLRCVQGWEMCECGEWAGVSGDGLTVDDRTADDRTERRWHEQWWGRRSTTVYKAIVIQFVNR